MYILHSLWFVFTLVSCCTASCCPEVCVLEDVECATRGARNVIKAIITGENGLAKPMDPLYLKRIEGNNGSTNYSLSKIEVKGLGNCVLLQLRLNSTEDASYVQYIHCPKLRFKYEVKEVSGPIIRAKKTSALAYNYNIINAGQYGIFVSERDHQPHFFIKFVITFVEHKGNLTFDNKLLDNTDGLATQETVNEDIENEKIEYLLSRILKVAMKKLLSRIDTYIRRRLMGVVIPAFPC